MTRSQRLGVIAAVVILLAVLVAVLARSSGDSLDQTMTALLESDGISGAVVLVGASGEEPEVRIFGQARPDAKTPLSPESRFRLASLTKPVTSAAINELVVRGDLSLRDRVVDLLPGLAFDSSIEDATLHDLLRHTSGIDEAADVGPLFLAADELQSELGLAADEVDCPAIADAMSSRPVTRPPSTATVYSNTGYCYLGLILQEQTGLGLEASFHELVPASSALTMDLDAVTVDHAIPPDQQDLPVMRPEAVAAAGSLVGSPAAYYDFLAEPVESWVSDAPPFSVDAQSYWGMGWRIWPELSCPKRTHVGSLPGAYTVAMIDEDGNRFVAFFNGRPSEDWTPFIDLVAAACDVLN